MIIYDGPYLHILFEEQNNRFVNSWNVSPNSEISFKSELMIYLKALERINPTQILWLNENFKFRLDDNIKYWVEKNILIPRHDAGFVVPDQDGYHPIAFVVGKDVLVHMEVMGLFDKPNPSVFQPKHFATEQEARDWLNSEFTEPLENPEIEIIYKGLNSDGKATFEIIESPKNIKKTIRLFKSIVEENAFIKNSYQRFSTLTNREREVLSFIANGNQHQDVARLMSISIHTVRDHLKSIKKKLDINSNRDIHLYHSAFLK